MVAGIALVMFGALVLAALVDLVAGGVGADPTVLGVPLSFEDDGQVLALAGALGVLGGAALAAGAMVFRSDRRRRRSAGPRARDEREDASRETVRRLLEERVEMLSATVVELERRQAELREGIQQRPSGTPVPNGTASKTAPLIVLPDAPSE